MDAEKTTTSDVVIIGGGLAGLTAALHLAERGLHPLVLEADPEHAGGRLKAGEDVVFEHREQTWRFATEHGMHGIWSSYRNLQAMWVRHTIRPVLVPAQEETWVYGTHHQIRKAPIGSAIRNSWIPAPFHYLGLLARWRFWAMLTPLDVLSMLPVLVTLLAALSIDPLGEDQPLHGLTLHEVCKGWSHRMKSLFIGLSRNGLPANPDQIPASGFFAFLRFYTLRRRDAWAFSYLPNESPTSVIMPLLRVINDLGGEIRVGAKVTQLARSAGGWRIAIEGNGRATPAIVEAPDVIIATDAPATEALLRAGQDTQDLAGQLRLPAAWASAVVRVWFDRQPQRGAEAGMFSGAFALDNFFWLDRIYTDYIRFRRETGGSAVEAHIYGPPELLAQPDAALLAHALSEITRTWPELRGHVIQSVLRRNPETHTLLRAGRPEDHLGIETPWPGVFCCGDWVRDPHPAMFMERACVTGIKAANAVLDARGLAPWPLLGLPRPEPLAWAVELAMRQARRALRTRARKKRKRDPIFNPSL
ncbi:MAG: FAD-dependent oxidoreductase [Anaerolineae bacterium]|nr:FAD-dependent oxidoreductase [Anaerolineae bacterium]